MTELSQGLILEYSLESAVAQEESREPYRAEIAQFTEQLFSQLKLPQDPMVLDLGSGLGALGKAMPRCNGMHYIGSDDNIEVALAGANHYDSYVTADTAHLPFADESLDAISGFDILNWVPNLDETVSETSRVLKPGGTAVFLQYAEPGINFLTCQDKVALPVVYKSGNLHVFETTKSTFEQAWEQVKIQLKDADDLEEFVAELDYNMTHAPNLLFHALLSDTEHMSDLVHFILGGIGRLVLANAEKIATEKQEEVTLFNRSTNWQRFTDHLEKKAAENGLSFEYGIFALATHLPKPLQVTALLLQKT